MDSNLPAVMCQMPLAGHETSTRFKHGVRVPLPWSAFLWPQFGAAIDMLENAIQACPEPLWKDRDRPPEFWYLAYHTLFWLDLYLSPSLQGFAPPPPFTLAELDPQGQLTDRPYAKDELLRYLRHGREKCRDVIHSLTDAAAGGPSGFAWLQCTVAELHLYNLRHVQHGAAQLNLRLRDAGATVPAWVARTATEPGSTS